LFQMGLEYQLDLKILLRMFESSIQTIENPL
jgi:hypothetical protein